MGFILGFRLVEGEGGVIIEQARLFVEVRSVVAGVPYLTEKRDYILNCLSGGVPHCTLHSTGSLHSKPGTILATLR